MREPHVPYKHKCVHGVINEKTGGRPNGALLEKIERKLKSPLGAPRTTEQPRRHGSSARYIRDPMTQGYRPGGACRPCGTIPRGNRLGAQAVPRCFSLYYLDARS